MLHEHWRDEIRDEIERRSRMEMFDTWSGKLDQLTQIKLADIYKFLPSIKEGEQSCI
jgi:hypothetical protein